MRSSTPSESRSVCVIATDAASNGTLTGEAKLRVDNIRQERAITSGAWDCVGFRIARDR
jgi:hypothetical protein